jgi:hypothetical protein
MEQINVQLLDYLFFVINSVSIFEYLMSRSMIAKEMLETCFQSSPCRVGKSLDKSSESVIESE